MSKSIQLTQDKFAVVDDGDYDKFNQWKWTAHFYRGKWYAKRSEGSRLLQKMILMHRAIMNVTDPKIEVDHRNGNGLDNRRENLRVCTHAENMHNRGKQSNNTTGFKGVHLFKRRQKFTAQIRNDGKTIHLGYFSTAEEAARAYDEKARELFGEFAWTNF